MSSNYNYIIKKYEELELMNSFGNHLLKKGEWDPFIYPDNGYIPPCSVCKNSYDQCIITLESNKDKKENNYSIELDWQHYKCGCLWSDYYEDKLKKINNNIRLVKNKN